MHRDRYRLALLIVLRLAAVMTLLAFPTIFLPEEWMAATHRFLGLGDLPRGPIVTYMARSLSMMYAFLGLITWGLSQDIDRYRSLIRLWAFAHIGMGLILLLVDFWSELPLFWTLSEGIPVALAGVVAWWLEARCR